MKQDKQYMEFVAGIFTKGVEAELAKINKLGMNLKIKFAMDSAPEYRIYSINHSCSGEISELDKALPSFRFGDEEKMFEWLYILFGGIRELHKSGHYAQQMIEQSTPY